MKTLHSILLLLLPLLAVSLLPASLGDEQTTALIRKVCGQTSDFAFCDGILERNLVSPKTDLPGLTRLTVSLTLSFAKDTLTFIQQSEAAEKDRGVKQLYEGCRGNYEKVVGFMQGAAFDAGKADYSHMVQLLQLSSKPVIICQNAIARVVPRMLEKNRLFRVLLSAALYEGTLL